MSSVIRETDVGLRVWCPYCQQWQDLTWEEIYAAKPQTACPSGIPQDPIVITMMDDIVDKTQEEQGDIKEQLRQQIIVADAAVANVTKVKQEEIDRLREMLHEIEIEKKGIEDGISDRVAKEVAAFKEQQGEVKNALQREYEAKKQTLEEERKREALEYQTRVNELNSEKDKIRVEVEERMLDEHIKKWESIDLTIWLQRNLPVSFMKSGINQFVLSFKGIKDVGKILLLEKRTKSWDKEWISRAKNDMNASQCEQAIIVSMALPKEIVTFGHVQGVLVTSFDALLPLLSMINITLLEKSREKALVATGGDKIKEVLTSANFKNAVANLAGVLEKEKARIEEKDKAYRRLIEADKQALNTIAANFFTVNTNLQLAIEDKTEKEYE